MNNTSVKKHFLTGLSLLITINLYPQDFVDSGITLPGVYQSSVAWGDYDADGDLDFLISGLDNNNQNLTRIYKNNGDQTFTEMSSIVLEQVSTSSGAWGDYDNDGDLDLLLTGYSDAGNISTLYRNNGDDNFSKQTDIVLPNVAAGFVSWGDYDNDGDLDFLISGQSNTGYVSIIYRNNGDTGFSRVENIHLPGIILGSSSWGDYDNDGDLDLLLVGFNNATLYSYEASVYRNDNGNFNYQTGILLPAIQSGNGMFADSDNDGDLDIFITGLGSDNIPLTKIFINNGNNTFTEQTEFNLEGLADSQLSLGDCDNDGDLDLLLTGDNYSGPVSKIYLNDNGFYTEIETVSLEGVWWGSSAWADYDNDGDLDILLTGRSDNYNISRIYKNNIVRSNSKPSIPVNLNSVIEDGVVRLSWNKSTDNETPANGLNYNIYLYESGKSAYEISPHAFKSGHSLSGKRLIPKAGNIQWTAEGHMIHGLSPDKTYMWAVQSIDAGFNGSEFTPEASFTLPSARPDIQADHISFETVSFPDEIVRWSNGSGSKRAVFIKAASSGYADPVDMTTYNINDLTPGGWKCIYNGSGNSTGLTGLTAGTDYLVHVCEYNGEPGNELYLNSVTYKNPEFPNTIFSVLPGENLPYSSISGTTQWIDFDNDGHLDFILTLGYSVKLFHNNNDASFTELTDNVFPEIKSCVVAAGDYDNDNDLDLLLSGQNRSNVLISRIYRNDGDNTFTERPDISLAGVASGSMKWADYDNDGDLDVVLTGSNVSKIYRNNGSDNFTENTGSDLVPVASSCVAWGDYNRDSYPDLLLTGSMTGNVEPVSAVYRNNKDNTFTHIDIENLTGVMRSSIAWGDYDNDGAQDILLSGLNASSEYITKVFRNNQNGTFNEQNEIVLNGVDAGSVSWIDYDNDGYLDISIAGNTGNEIIFKIWHNDRNGKFTEKVSLPGIYNGAISWGDYDNDGDMDIIVTGKTENAPCTRIFTNHISKSNIKPPAPANLESIWENDKLTLKWSKVSDNNTSSELEYNLRIGTTPGGNDIRSGQALPTGELLSPSINHIIDNSITLKLPVNKYYWSVQSIDKASISGDFSTENTIPADSIQANSLQAKIKDGSLRLRWKNGNGSGRAVFCRIASSEPKARPIHGKLYHADPYFAEGDFIESTSWFCVFYGKTDSTTIYGLSEKYSYDIQVIEYVVVNGSPIYFRNSANGNPAVFSTGIFSEQTNILLPGVYNSSSSWADYDNDGDLDILITGSTTGRYSGDEISKIFRNNGDFTFSEQTEITLPGISHGTAVWGDFNNDQALDILMSGRSINGSEICALYKNDGNNSFTDVSSDNMTGLSDGSAAFSDFDSDGDLDILLTGNDHSYTARTRIYLNIGSNQFINYPGELTGLVFSSIAIGDYDNDGDPDLLNSGTTDGNYTGAFTRILENTDEIFIEKSDPVFPNLFKSSVAFGDFDNDEDLDVVISGENKMVKFVSNIYENSKDSFSILGESELTDQGLSNTKWGDYDNDGDLDLITIGTPASLIYRNEAGHTFKESYTGIPSIRNGSAAWGDYDNDGDLDILVSGEGIAMIYQNNTIMRAGAILPNNKPKAPENLEYSVIPQGTILRWSPVRNDETSFSSMTYNVKIWKNLSSAYVVSGQADTGTGYRHLPEMGNAQLDTSFFIKNLESGIYYWQVQAVDQAYAGGAWSGVSTFEVKTVQTFFSSDEVCHGFPTHFTDQSVATSGVASWKWDFRDGSTSSSQNPVHTYSASGTYNVKLVITDAGGTKDSLEQAVVVRPKPLTGFDSPSVCQGIPVTATNTTDNNGLTVSSWSWDFGDGSSSSLQQPAPHPYLNAADYTIKLKAIASNGCADSVNKVVSVGSYPVAAVTSSGPLTFCKGDSVTLTVPLNPEYSYSWMISGTDLTGANQNIYKAKSTSSYTVRITNPKGNCISTSPAVNVTSLDTPSAPLISSSGNSVFCEGDSAVLSIAAVPGSTYDWKRDGGSVGSNNTYPAKVSGEYQVVVSNSSGCKAASTNKINITVNLAPARASISTNGVTTFCEGGSVSLSVPPVPGNSYFWKKDDGTIKGAEGSSYLATVSGSYLLDIKNSYGCSTRSLPVNVTVKQSPLMPLLDSLNYVKGKCPGENPVRLSAKEVNDNYEYLWYKDGVALDHNLSYLDIYEAGYYKLSAELDGCISESKVFNADFPAGPAKPLIYAQGPSFWYLACSDTTANKYKWYFNGKLIEGADKYYYIANYKLGTYQVSIANKDLCYTRSDIITIPPGYTSADDEVAFKGVVIYPNPTAGLITIELLNNLSGKLTIEIFSLEGRKVLDREFEKTAGYFRDQVDLSGNTPGMYLINLSLNKYFFSGRILIQ